VGENEEVQAKYAKVHPDFLQMQADALNSAIGHYRPLLPDWPALGQAIGENINAALSAEQEMADILGL